MYLSFAIFQEGNSDREYFGVLIPRLIESLILNRGCFEVEVAEQPIDLVMPRKSIKEVAQAACDASDSFHLFFVHTDTGGRALAQQVDDRGMEYCREMNRICQWPCARCVVIAPRHETEAWILLDTTAVAQALGVNGNLAAHGMPKTAKDCEGLVDPKAALNSVIQSVRGRRRSVDRAADLYPAIAARQTMAVMREAVSFRTFEDDLRSALISLGCLQR
jgi:hypothetical protein